MSGRAAATSVRRQSPGVDRGAVRRRQAPRRAPPRRGGRPPAPRPRPAEGLLRGHDLLGRGRRAVRGGGRRAGLGLRLRGGRGHCVHANLRRPADPGSSCGASRPRSVTRPGAWAKLPPRAPDRSAPCHRPSPAVSSPGASSPVAQGAACRARLPGADFPAAPGQRAGHEFWRFPAALAATLVLRRGKGASTCRDRALAGRDRRVRTGHLARGTDPRPDPRHPGPRHRGSAHRRAARVPHRAAPAGLRGPAWAGAEQSGPARHGQGGQAVGRGRWHRRSPPVAAAAGSRHLPADRGRPATRQRRRPGRRQHRQHRLWRTGASGMRTAAGTPPVAAARVVATPPPPAPLATAVHTVHHRARPPPGRQARRLRLPPLRAP